MNSDNNEVELPGQLAYSVRIEQCSTGARVTVRTNSNSISDCIQEAIDMYVKAKGTLEAIGEKVSPIIIKESKV